MPLSIADRRAIEAYLGPLTDSEEVAMDEATERLGSAYAAALEELLVRHSEMVSTVADLSSQGDRSNHAANLAWMERQIRMLVAFVSANSDITFGGAAANLLAQVTASLPQSTFTVPMVAANRRRG
jgi:hypothetical protein